MTCYNIQIPNEKAATYKVVTFIISIINLLALCYVLVNTAGTIKFLFAIGMAAGITAVVVAAYQWRSVNKKLSLQPWLFLVICAGTWMLAANYYLGLSLLVFAILSHITGRPLVIRFSEAEVIYPSFPARTIEWAAIDFVLLKDDILSIELRNNQLLQFTLDGAVAARIDAAAFNAFCRKAAARPTTV